MLLVLISGCNIVSNKMWDKKFFIKTKNFGSNTVGPLLDLRPCHRQDLGRSLSAAFAFGPVVSQSHNSAHFGREPRVQTGRRPVWRIKFNVMKKTILSLSLLLAVSIIATRASAQLSVGISIYTAPPAIPVYTQPPCPVDGYIWIPGYWAWDPDMEGYFWVPGYWEAPPQVGFLWTPGYWAFVGGVYSWHVGYWGPHVGYYGGINYGCGYGGSGYYGGEWYNGRFRYNTAVTRVNTTVVHNTYINRTVINNVTVNKVSYNGGPGGVNYHANAREEAAMRDRHIERTAEQQQHQQTAMRDRNQFASVNHGRPTSMAVTRPAVYRPSAPITANNRPRPQENRAQPQMNRPAPQPQMSRPQPEMNRPRPQENRAQPQMNRPQPQMNRPQPQMNRPQPQTNRPQPQMNRPQPQMNRPQPIQRPQPQPPRGGGGGGRDDHHHGR